MPVSGTMTINETATHTQWFVSYQCTADECIVVGDRFGCAIKICWLKAKSIFLFCFIYIYVHKHTHVYIYIDVCVILHQCDYVFMSYSAAMVNVMGCRLMCYLCCFSL